MEHVVKSLDIEVNVRNGYYESPMKPPPYVTKPHLKSKHTSLEAQEYVTKLARYEKSILVYKDEMAEYRRVKNRREEEFRNDAIKHAGLLLGSKSAERAFTMASDRGGVRLEIVENLEEIADVMIMYMLDFNSPKHLRGAVG